MGEIADHAALVGFAKECLRIAWEGGSLEGDELQEIGLKHGLLDLVEFDPSKHKDPNDYAEEGDDWYVFAGPLARGSRP